MNVPDLGQIRFRPGGLRKDPRNFGVRRPAKNPAASNLAPNQRLILRRSSWGISDGSADEMTELQPPHSLTLRLNCPNRLTHTPPQLSEPPHSTPFGNRRYADMASVMQIPAPPSMRWLGDTVDAAGFFAGRLTPKLRGSFRKSPGQDRTWAKSGSGRGVCERTPTMLV